MKLESREKIFQETEAVEGEDYTVGDAKGLVCVLAQSTFPMTTNDLCWLVSSHLQSLTSEIKEM